MSKKVLPLSFLFVFFALSCAWAKTSVYYNYPAGSISESRVYEIFNAHRAALRNCHSIYLDQIPGAFDCLSVEFTVSPEGKVISFNKPQGSEAKQEGIGCAQSIIKNLRFPEPDLGIATLRFTSDLDLMVDPNAVKDQSLSRNSIRLLHYLPQKLISANVEMFMPYYKKCMAEQSFHGKATLSWTIENSGTVDNVSIEAPSGNEVFEECMISITSKHNYPSGFERTQASRILNVK